MHDASAIVLSGGKEAQTNLVMRANVDPENQIFLFNVLAIEKFVEVYRRSTR